MSERLEVTTTREGPLLRLCGKRAVCALDVRVAPHAHTYGVNFTSELASRYVNLPGKLDLTSPCPSPSLYHYELGLITSSAHCAGVFSFSLKCSSHRTPAKLALSGHQLSVVVA